ncbi:MAG: Sec-dependent nitrous-oxide reductase [Leptospira sp.]|nr:Sec-dependent nitrous-oxide reductase [Leptospira sp.]
MIHLPKKSLSFFFLVLVLSIASNCKKGASTAVLASDAASRVYVAPGEKDEVYAFLSGGFNGQMSVYGIPSSRLFKIIPVFSVFPENGYGFDEETKDMLKTTHGYVPWDDSHHVEASMTDGKQDGRWMFLNANNTPRLARIDLKSFETKEIIEIPNTAGNHASPFATENTEFLMAATRFSVPIPNVPLPIENFSKGDFKGTITMVKVEKDTGRLSIDLQILVPGFNYDLSHCGKNKSHDWCFFSSYNSEQAHKMLEVGASKKDKDFILAFNWVRAQECKAQGKAANFGGEYVNNFRPENKPAVSTRLSGVKMLQPKDCPGMMYYMPTPKSPHGTDVDPTGEYIVGGGKLASVIPVHSFSKMIEVKDKAEHQSGDINGIPILKYESTLAGEVKKPCLGPLHTEFDGKGFAYTSCFVSSEVVKWELGTWEVVQHLPAYYSVGHLSIVGGSSKEPYGKYLVAMNKITKDRYLPVGMELPQSAQLYDISSGKAELLSDFPTVGEPHYSQMIPAKLIMDKTTKLYPLEENNHPYAVKSEKDTRVVREGGAVHVYMTAIRSHFKPDTIEARSGETLYFHVTNLEQDYDIPHGFAISGAPNMPNLLIMPGETKTFKWIAPKPGIYPFYCTDFCSALHQEMQQYIRVSQ